MYVGVLTVKMLFNRCRLQYLNGFKVSIRHLLSLSNQKIETVAFAPKNPNRSRFGRHCSSNTCCFTTIGKLRFIEYHQHSVEVLRPTNRYSQYRNSTSASNLDWSLVLLSLERWPRRIPVPAKRKGAPQSLCCVPTLIRKSS